jgi:CARDB
MQRSVWAVSLLLSLGCLGLLAASPASAQTLMIRPDLWPDPGPPQSSFCKRAQGNLVVTVRSVGPASAPLAPFYVKVEFKPGGAFEKPVERLVPGSTADVQFAIPPGCFTPDCHFTITVDSRKNIRESDKSNNVADGRCPRGS